MFLEAGAQIGSNITQNADIVLKVQANESDLSNFEKNALLIGLLSPHNNKAFAEKLAAANVNAFSMELV